MMPLATQGAMDLKSAFEKPGGALRNRAAVSRGAHPMSLVRRAALRGFAIAPGIGQAILRLANLGYRIRGVELGTRRRAFAHDRLKTYPRVEVVNTSLVAVQLPMAALNFVYPATAPHWIARRRGFKNRTRCLGRPR
jgi:hypothetical protein